MPRKTEELFHRRVFADPAWCLFADIWPDSNGNGNPLLSLPEKYL